MILLPPSFNMFKNLININANNTRDLRFTNAANWLHVRSIIRTEALQQEASSLAAHYPLVFSQADEGQMLQVIMGSADTNLFINAQGQWLAPVIPAQLRALPFTYARINDTDTYTLVANRDTPHWGSDGQALYNEAGEPTEMLSQIAAFAKLVLQDGLRTQQLVGQLAAAGVIAEGVVTVTLKDGTQRAFAGFRTVHEDNLAALDAATRQALTSTGAMALLQAHQQSLQNFARIDR